VNLFDVSSLLLTDKEDQFEKKSHHLVDTLGTNYDFESVMHYGRDEGSKNGRPTVII
jgi:hypothetical protein